MKLIRTGCERIPEGGHNGTSYLDEPHHRGGREVGIEERAIGVSLSRSGASGRQIPESRIFKRPSGNGKSFRLMVNFQAGKESRCHPTLCRVPGTILGSSGQTGLNTKNAYPKTFGVHVLPHLSMFKITYNHDI
jgi:hypothetical protein